MDTHHLTPGLDLRALQRTSWEVAESKGFHDAQEDLPRKTLALYLRLLLTVGELSEAAEELREGHAPGHLYYEHETPNGVVPLDEPIAIWTEQRPGRWIVSCTFDDAQQAGSGNIQDYERLTIGKPAGFPVELADVLIRLCDLAEGCGVDLSLVTKAKEDYNRTRAFLHGKQA
jgi:hypothetical protein